MAVRTRRAISSGIRPATYNTYHLFFIAFTLLLSPTKKTKRERAPAVLQPLPSVHQHTHASSSVAAAADDRLLLYTTSIIKAKKEAGTYTIEAKKKKLA